MAPAAAQQPFGPNARQSPPRAGIPNVIIDGQIMVKGAYTPVIAAAGARAIAVVPAMPSGRGALPRREMEPGQSVARSRRNSRGVVPETLRNARAKCDGSS